MTMVHKHIRIFFLLLVFLCCFTTAKVYCQFISLNSDIKSIYVQPRPENDSLNSETTPSLINIPTYGIYVAAGWVGGGRIGGIIQFQEHLSAEISYGYDLRNFFSASDIITKYLTGVNWHWGASSRLVLSFLVTHNIEPSNSVSSSNQFSFTVGLLTLKNRGLNVFGRAGGYIEVPENNNIRANSFGVNLDVGLIWVFK